MGYGSALGSPSVAVCSTSDRLRCSKGRSHCSSEKHPGGVISLRMADPTDKFEVIGRGDMKLNPFPTGRVDPLRSDGRHTEGSAWRASTLPARMASKCGHRCLGTGPSAASTNRPTSRLPIRLRGTALWNPFNQFYARLKLNFVYDRSLYDTTHELVSCPDGTSGPAGIPFIGPYPCGLSRQLRIVDLNPADFPGIATMASRTSKSISKTRPRIKLSCNARP